MNKTFIGVMFFALLTFTSCGSKHNVDIDEVRGKTTHEFGPNFEAWLTYCKGKAQYKFDIGQITSNEIDIETRECYYNLDMDLPDLEGEA